MKNLTISVSNEYYDRLIDGIADLFGFDHFPAGEEEVPETKEQFANRHLEKDMLSHFDDLIRVGENMKRQTSASE